jgi:hypothetical protein
VLQRLADFTAYPNRLPWIPVNLRSEALSVGPATAGTETMGDVGLNRLSATQTRQFLLHHHKRPPGHVALLSGLSAQLLLTCRLCGHYWRFVAEGKRHGHGIGNTGGGVRPLRSNGRIIRSASRGYIGAPAAWCNPAQDISWRPIVKLCGETRDTWLRSVRDRRLRAYPDYPRRPKVGREGREARHAEEAYWRSNTTTRRNTALRPSQPTDARG